jgi:hypothetical protein
MTDSLKRSTRRPRAASPMQAAADPPPPRDPAVWSVGPNVDGPDDAALATHVRPDPDASPAQE